MPFIGNQPALSYTSFAKQDFTTSATTSYTLDNPVANANELALFINFVRQEPTTAYSASGTTLTLTEATSSSDDMYCVYLGKAVQTVNPPNASVGTSQLVDGAVTSAKLSAGKVLQVVNTVNTTRSTRASSSFGDISGQTVNITPSSSNNKILIINYTSFALADNSYGFFKLLRDSTVIQSGSDDGNRIGCLTSIAGVGTNAVHHIRSISFQVLDTPNTTSQITYKMQSATRLATTIAFNRTINDWDENYTARPTSGITAIEISG